MPGATALTLMSQPGQSTTMPRGVLPERLWRRLPRGADGIILGVGQPAWEAHGDDSDLSNLRHSGPTR
jgi:hypothetical protein